MTQETSYDVAIVGAGFTGLTAALDLTRAGKRVIVLENDSGPGGLAGTFQFRDGVRVEKFYHHWFTNDAHVKFQHEPHYRAGITCATCHGDVAKMTVAERAVTHNMGTCLTCHRQRNGPQDCAACHY